MPTQMFFSGARIGGSNSTSLSCDIGRPGGGGARFVKRAGTEQVEQARIFRSLRPRSMRPLPSITAP